jgi:hypothetical protein
MAISTNGTKLSNLINPQVLADMISAELPNKIVLAPLAVIGRELVGVAGNTLTFPKYGYIGDATDVAEGADISIAQMSTTSVPVTVKKAGKGVEISDEAVLSGYGDPVGQAREQLLMSVANKVDNDLFVNLRGASLTSNTAGAKITSADIFTAVAKFGERLEEPCVLLVNPVYYPDLVGEIIGLSNTDNVLMSGVVGRVGTAQVLFSDKVAKNEAFLVKEGALGVELKRDVEIEADRDIIAKLTVITVDEHYVTYLKDDTKAVKITITGATA